MYLEHFNIQEKPFGLTPNVDYFIDINGGQDLINVLLVSLNNGEGFLKVVGEVGTGKTLLCRKLLNSLDSTYKTAYIASPCFNEKDIFAAVATELGLKVSGELSTHDILLKLNKHLIALHKKNKKTVLIIDEAQALTDTSLEAVRLLTNLETKTSKLLQLVLVGQPELDVKLSRPHMRQLLQRIIFSLKLKSLNRKEMDVYINNRLCISGYNKNNLFSNKALGKIFAASNGIPRLINILCHKAMLAAYGKNSPVISAEHAAKAINDTEGLKQESDKFSSVSSVCLAIFTIVTTILLLSLSG